MYYDESAVYARLCEKLYGRNLLQMGMGTVDEMDILLDGLQIKPEDRVLDIGCCFGRVTEYLCDKTGADFTGIDIHEKDLSVAKRVERENLRFLLADMTRLPFAGESFDKIISLDSLYYAVDLEKTLDSLFTLLKPAGRLCIFWSQPPRIQMGDPPTPEQAEVGSWAASRKLAYKAVDRISEHRAFWEKSKKLFVEMESEFKNEGMGYHWEQQIKEQREVEALVSAGKFPRWLYFINKKGVGA
ncbi:MAG: class I SAM-dependent methyltransferase [Clostridiales bacterium]|jgi:ubiquinone/menaquinone biosynthesis C-methylase UbiE|nr:class I SAM-dependent methyltransferase [Clostridiales bacterium]